MPKIALKLKLPTSIYAAIEKDNKLFAGGSVWDRRQVLWSDEVGKQTKGIVYIFKKVKNSYQKIQEIVFPHMVYSIIELPKKQLFVSCKAAKGAFNIINFQGEIIKTKNDKAGQGVYGSFYNKSKKEIILTTRSGKLEIINSQSLEIKKKLQLAQKSTRLWALAMDEKTQTIYAGDYDGFVYIVKRNQFTKTKKINLKQYYKDNQKLEKGFGPSVWSILSYQNKIIVATRWHELFIFDKNFKLTERIDLGEDISHLEKLSPTKILIGTRYGKLFSLDLKTKKKKTIIKRKPKLQKENAIWEMSRAKQGMWICFADGYVIKII